MQQMYRRTPMPNWDFNKLIEIALWHGCSPVYLLHAFVSPFSKKISGGLLLIFREAFERMDLKEKISINVAELLEAVVLRCFVEKLFSCEFCKNFDNTFFYRTPPVAASELLYLQHYSVVISYVRMKISKIVMNFTFQIFH